MFRYILIFLLLFGLVAEIYTFVAVRTVVKTKWVQWLYLGISVAIIVYIVYAIATFDRGHGQTKTFMYTVALLLLTFVPKMIIGVILLGEDIVRLISGLVKLIAKGSAGGFLPERRKFVSAVALSIAAIPFLSIIYGITKGKYNFKVRRKTITFPDLPERFDGFVITQISDVHSGSLDDAEKIEYAINLVNEQKSDIILFTGDIVNTYAEEMHPWIDAFNKIEEAPYGKFSVLGNHDYGEYAQWPSAAAKNENFEAIKKLYGQIGFTLLLNENVKISKGGQHIALAGVENWGQNFKQAGDLNKASQGLKPEDFKILMSHDPSHWEYEVKNSPHNYHLTFSGHTHGMQLGIEVPPFIKWSPVQYIYKQWAGLYSHLGRYIYVNRGFGFHGYNGRTGIWPEITVITLKKG